MLSPSKAFKLAAKGKTGYIEQRKERETGRTSRRPPQSSRRSGRHRTGSVKGTDDGGEGEKSTELGQFGREIDREREKEEERRSRFVRKKSSDHKKLPRANSGM